jgi:hypothetical protein
LVLITGRLWWGVLAHRKLTAAWVDLQNQGLLHTSNESDKSDFHSEYNPGFWIQRAIESIDRTLIAAYIGAEGHAALVRQNWPSIKSEEPMYADARRYLRLASRLPSGHWPERESFPPGAKWTSPAINDLEPRMLARLLRTAALVAFLEGDHEECVQSMLDVLTMTRTIDYASATAHSHIAFLRIENSVAQLIKEILPWLMIGEIQNDSGVRPASPESVRALMGKLLNNDANSRFRNMMYADRAYNMSWMGHWLDGRDHFPSQGSPIVPRLLFRPYLEACQLEWLLRTEDVIAAASLPSWGEAIEELNPNPLGFHVDRFLLRYVLPFGPNNEHTLLRYHFTYIARMRLAAAALALRLYQTGGRSSSSAIAPLPESLDELTWSVHGGPWLEMVPVDPFGDGQQAIQYIPDGPLPLMYSFGINGRDDGGISATPSTEFIEGDIVFILTGHPDAEPFATNPIGSP